MNKDDVLDQDNTSKFIPYVQQMVLIENDDLQDEIMRLNKQIEEIPFDYQQPTDEEILQKGSEFNAMIVYARFFSNKINWFVLSWDRENDIVNCYVIGQGKDFFLNSLGDTFLKDLTTTRGIELDFYWKRKSLAQALHEKYPDDFPKPIQNTINQK